MQGDLFANFTGNEPGEAKNSNLATLETLNCDYQLIDTEEKREAEEAHKPPQKIV